MSSLNKMDELEVRLKFPPVNFIPYACHFNPHTILTKNGELLQTIKVEGFGEAFDQLQKVDLRKIINEIVFKHIKNPKFALYFHTIRRKKSIDPPSSYNYKIAEEIHKLWVKKNFWDDKFVNDIYITIIYQGTGFPIFSGSDFLRSIFFQLEKDFHTKYLVKSFKKLEEVATKITNDLSQYGAKRLSIQIDQEGPHSENLTFFSKIIHLNEVRSPLPVNDLSYYLTTHKMAFGADSLEIYGDNGKHFASLFSIKEYQDTNLEALDKILQAPIEFVITQSVNFIPTQKAKKPFEYQDYIYKLNKEGSLRKASGIEYLMDNNGESSSTRFADSQMTIMVTSEDIKGLRNRCVRIFNEFAKLGFVIFKEDLNLEQCFWSQLPGNFFHLKRQSILPNKLIPSFAFSHSFSSGKRKSKWGNAVTLLRTISGNPYFFNFHFENNGNTIVLGQEGTGKKTLINFLLSETLKYDPEIKIIEPIPDSEVFIKSLGGSYKFGLPSFQPNFFQDSNKEFLSYFFKIIDPNLTDDMINNLINIFSDDSATIEPILPSYMTKITELLSSEEFSNYIFASQEEENSKIQGYCLNQVSSTSLIFKVAIIHTLFKMAKTDNKSPKILVIDNAEILLNDSFYTLILNKLLKEIEENNGIVILSMKELKTDLQQENFAILSKNIGSIINTSLAVKEHANKNLYGLNRDTFEELRYFQLINRALILQQGEEIIILELSLNGLDPVLDILSPSRRSKPIAQKILSSSKDNITVSIKEIFTGITE